MSKSFQKVNVHLYSNFPEILSNSAGDVSLDFDNCKGKYKEYTFYSCIQGVGDLEVNDLVICQVNNTMAVGRVVRHLTYVIKDDFFRATLKRSEKVRNGYRLILARIPLVDLSTQLGFKHAYERAKLELAKKPSSINEEAFKLALDRL